MEIRVEEIVTIADVVDVNIVICQWPFSDASRASVCANLRKLKMSILTSEGYRISWAYAFQLFRDDLIARHT